MTTAKVTECVLKYVKEEFAKIDTKCKMNVEMVHGGEPWMADPNVSQGPALVASPPGA